MYLGVCAESIRKEKKVPIRSIVAGHDFGILSRMLHNDSQGSPPVGSDWQLSFAEKLCITMYRPYIQILKLIPAEGGRSTFVGHVITFPQNAPEETMSRADSSLSSDLPQETSR